MTLPDPFILFSSAETKTESEQKTWITYMAWCCKMTEPRAAPKKLDAAPGSSLGHQPLTPQAPDNYHQAVALGIKLVEGCSTMEAARSALGFTQLHLLQVWA